MPNLVELKANFASSASDNKPGVAELPANATVSSKKIADLMHDVKIVKMYWDEIKKSYGRIPKRVIIEAHYNKTIAKSRRVEKLLAFPKGIPTKEDTIGARFEEDSDRHVISYALPYDFLERTIDYLDHCIEYMKSRKIDNFTTETLHAFNEEGKNRKNIEFSEKLKSYGLTKSGFSRTIVDANYVDNFSKPKEFEISDEPRIVTLFKIDDADKLLKFAGLEDEIPNLIGDSILLDNKSQAILHNNAPYLVAMSVCNFAEAPDLGSTTANGIQPTIQRPESEPIIGVIDTQFKNDVYFHEWVDYMDVLNGAVHFTDEDYAHGTAVSSIIVDGPTLNKRLDDNCGRFRVKHFGVGTRKNIDIYTVAKRLEDWVRQNPEIHVWNISLGTKSEIEKSSVSFLAAILDDIQSRYNVIFVVAGTNDDDETLSKKIGSPADSINSLVVNAVNSQGEKPKYARKGPALSFFMKPDICAFGGDNGDEMTVYGFVGTRPARGTSLAAPWIARKLSFLIDKMNLPIPVAKALIIDSAVTWNNDDVKRGHEYYGYGIVPIRIEDVLNSKKDEIKFYLTTDINSYHTYLYDIPVPLVKGKFPFIAKATMCYMSDCSRNYGIDYTNTELDFKFGRVKKTGVIESINDDRQYERKHFTLEEDSRRLFRKWDNVKNIVQEFNPKLRDKNRFSDQYWGIDIKMASRNTLEKQQNIRVGIVVTLKELHGVNRHSAFAQYCRLRHFIVNEIDIESRIELDNVLNQEIDITD